MSKTVTEELHNQYWSILLGRVSYGFNGWDIFQDCLTKFTEGLAHRVPQIRPKNLPTMKPFQKYVYSRIKEYNRPHNAATEKNE
jgi:hypothetical protein